ncbi:MAG: DUF952 domain-containing protein [Anaerolineales bacterium]|nr:DUF952 domain-containing protein [Anaerolineales bacterium]
MKFNFESPLILHICTSVEWYANETQDYKPVSIDSDGFIHCSKPQQLLWVANTFYHNTPDLLVLWIDPAQLNVPLKWEASEGDIFPHIYGSLNREAVIAYYPFTPESDGIFRKIPGLSEKGEKSL